MPSWTDDPYTEEEAAALGRLTRRIAAAIAAVFALLVVALVAVGLTQATVTERTVMAGKAEYGYGQIRYGGKGPEAWRWQFVLEKRDGADLQRRLTRRVLEVRALRRQVRSTLAFPTGHWLDGAFLCIHRFERHPNQGWQTATGNGFNGGLQMDADFQRTYGPEWARRAFGESAHLWPASVQISAAIHAWTTRGFGPWPNTSRMCGLR